MRKLITLTCRLVTWLLKPILQFAVFFIFFYNFRISIEPDAASSAARTRRPTRCPFHQHSMSIFCVSRFIMILLAHGIERAAKNLDVTSS